MVHLERIHDGFLAEGALDRTEAEVAIVPGVLGS
jgi:hypothetical protein